MMQADFVSCRARVRLACAGAAVFVLCAFAKAAPPPFFENGRTAWKVCLAPQPDPAAVYAAQELTNALKKISGAAFSIEAGGEVPAEAAVVIGDLRHPEVAAHAGELGLSPGEVEQTAVRTLGGRLYLAGNQPRGALYAVYSFLQRELGVRWLWPGPDGEFITARDSWVLPEISYRHLPGFAYRGFHLCGDWRDHQAFRVWMARNFINIHRHAASEAEKRMGFFSMWSSHNAALSEKKYFAAHPEYFAELGGTRYASNICLSHPDVLKIVAEEMSAYLRKHPELEILSIFPSDNQDYCRCAACARADVSTVWFEFYNRLTDLLKTGFPKLKFATIAYQGYREVPKCPVRNSLFVEYASYSRCNVHRYGDTNCPLNAATAAAFDAWQATGLPIGHYAYEYDIFSKNERFVPFLSVIGDAIKDARRRNLPAMITEVSLSPKEGPVTSVNNVQNRLSLYLYARLLWEPDADVEAVLRDWCDTAYGDAAVPMADYFRAMDRAWSGMREHATILGDALRLADAFMTDELRGRAAACLDAAGQAMARQSPSAGRDRVSAALEREKVLYRQWLDLYTMKRGGVPLVNLPLLAHATNFTDAVCRPLSIARLGGAEVRAAWTRDALLLRWSCPARAGSEPFRGAGARDADLSACDSVGLALAGGLDSGERHFAVSSSGARADTLISAVGVKEPQWNPDWQCRAIAASNRWEAEMVIPFAAAGLAPVPDDSIQARLLRHVPEGRGAAEEGTNVLFYFSAAPRTGRRLLWWSGAPERERSREPAIKQAFTRAGWEMMNVSTQSELSAAHRVADAFWFRHPNGSNKVPANYWAEQLAPAVSNGALAVFVSYWGMPLERYFNDASFKVSVVTYGAGLPLAGRRTETLSAGGWCRKPNDLTNRLKEGYSPCYGFQPADTNAWTVLATAANGPGRPAYPYLLARRYGKGLVVVGGDDIPVSVASLLENLAAWEEAGGK